MTRGPEPRRAQWATVGSIIERVVARLRPDDVLDGLRCIGVDELSYRRHYEYVTVVTNVQRTNRPLYRAYLLKETLAKILEGGRYVPDCRCSARSRAPSRSTSRGSSPTSPRA